MLITSNQNPDSLLDDLNGVAHSKHVSIFGNAGLQEYQEKNSLNDFQPEYGHFVLTRKIKGGVSVETDYFGLGKVYVYQHGKYWALSDSIVDLTNFAKEVGGGYRHISQQPTLFN